MIRRRLRISLTLKIVCYTIFLMIAVATGVTDFIIRHERTLLVEQLKQRGISIAVSTASNSAYGVFSEDKEILDGFIKNALQRDVSYVSISNQEGKILACSRRDLIGTVDEGINKNATDQFLITHFQKEEFFVQVPIKIAPPETAIASPELILSSSFPVSERNLIGFVHLAVSLEDMNSQVDIAKKKIILGTFLLSILILSCTILFLNRIIREPLHELVKLTQEVAEGNLDCKVTIRSSDEISDLSYAFNRMTQDLKYSRTEIENYNKTLEEKVKERTNQLQQTNEQLKKTQEELIQSAKMTAIGQLGAGVAHELNNPLGGILGYVQYILQKVQMPVFTQEDFNTCQKYLGYIERETKRCKSIVENLLSFSRKSSCDMHPTDIQKVLDDTLSILSHQLKLKGLTVSIELAKSLPLIEANPNQLQQVFTNIIINAQQAMEKGGSLTIIAQAVSDEQGRPHGVEIRFSDTGCGIPKENLTKIFDPFFTTKREWKGTGLGLSVSYEIVRAHKGKMKVESEEGVGSTFIVYLPVLDKQEKNPYEGC